MTRELTIEEERCLYRIAHGMSVLLEPWGNLRALLAEGYVLEADVATGLVTTALGENYCFIHAWFGSRL